MRNGGRIPVTAKHVSKAVVTHK